MQSTSVTAIVCGVDLRFDGSDQHRRQNFFGYLADIMNRQRLFTGVQVISAVGIFVC